ncbi:MAG: carbonic anhydrase, partial [Myxococcales bacterium]|nr:carbonic anhydrase [Myxococcales bacterium]
HTGCGAMKALMDPPSTANLPAIRKWLHHAEPVRQVVEVLEPGDDHLAREVAAIKVNVVQQLCNLRTHPSVAAALYRGDLTLHGWVYDIQTGLVRAYDPMTQAFVPLGDPHRGIADGVFADLGHADTRMVG